MSEKENKQLTAITTKDLRKAFNAAKGNSKELIEAEIDDGYQTKFFGPERNNAIG